MKTQIALIGAGQLGSRHLQSQLQLPLAPADPGYEARNPGVGACIAEYNAKLNQFFTDFPTFKVVPIWAPNDKDYASQFCADDGYHLSENGNRTVFSNLINRLDCLRHQ